MRNDVGSVQLLKVLKGARTEIGLQRTIFKSTRISQAEMRVKFDNHHQNNNYGRILFVLQISCAIYCAECVLAYFSRLIS